MFYEVGLAAPKFRSDKMAVFEAKVSRYCPRFGSNDYDCDGRP